jgi:citrate synthase
MRGLPPGILFKAKIPPHVMSLPSAKLRIADKEYDLPVIVGTENEHAVDIRNLRANSGYIAYDDGYGNTGSCESKITFIDGDLGILRYRGYAIEELAEKSTFMETAFLTIHGELPSADELSKFRAEVRDGALLHEGMRQTFSGFPHTSHPMAVLSAMLNALGCYHPELATNDREKDNAGLDKAAAVLLSKVRTIAAVSHRMRNGLPVIYPKSNYSYCENFLHMMFSQPYAEYQVHPDVAKALDVIFLLHADHEQNCSTSTLRMVASGGANLFASASAAACALWGPLHGGANQAVIEMLEEIHASGDDGTQFIKNAKEGKGRLMGFGHRVYKNYDPRAKIIKVQCDKVLAALGRKDPLLEIARKIEDAALNDEYFKKRNLYPNVDFYSGIILRAIGIPVEMFTVIFAIGRMPGWIAQWKEIAENPKQKIHRPRQIYTGATLRPYVGIDRR